MFPSVKFAILVLLVSLSSTCSTVSASEFNPEFPSLPSKRRAPEEGFNEEGRDNKKMRTTPQNQTQEEKVYFYFPLEVLSRVLEFSDLQSFYRFKLVSKEMKKETEREGYQIPEGEKVITWISSFSDKDTHLFDFDVFFSDFSKRNSHTKDSHKRFFNAANLYEQQNSLFHFKRLFYGHESKTEASLSQVCANLLKEIESLEKDPKPQSFAVLQEKRQQLKEMLLVWQPYAIAHDLAIRMFAQNGSVIWDDIKEIAQKCSTLQPYLLNPYMVGFYGSELGLEQLPKLQQTLLIIRDQLTKQEIIKAFQLRDFTRKEELPHTYAKAAQEAHDFADLLTQKKEACIFYEKEAYFLKQHAYYLNLSYQAEAFLRSAKCYSKVGHLLQESDSLKAEELVKEASQTTLDSLKYLMKLSETDYPDIYTIFKEAASLIISSDEAKAAKFCEKTANFIRRGDRYIDCVEAALSYIIAGEFIKETDPAKANLLFQKADDQELALMKIIKVDETDEVNLNPEDAEEISDSYKEAALCLELYNKKRAATFYAKAEDFKKYAEDFGDESSQSSVTDGG